MGSNHGATVEARNPRGSENHYCTYIDPQPGHRNLYDTYLSFGQDSLYEAWKPCKKDPIYSPCIISQELVLTYIHICMYTHIRTNTHTYTYIDVCIYIYVHINKDEIYIYMYKYIYIYTNLHIYICNYTIPTWGLWGAPRRRPSGAQGRALRAGALGSLGRLLGALRGGPPAPWPRDGEALKTNSLCIHTPSMYVYTCLHIIYIYTPGCVYIYVCVHIYAYIYIYTYMASICMCVCMSTAVYIYICTYIYIYMYIIYTYMCMYIYICIYTHMCHIYTAHVEGDGQMIDR